MRAAPGASDYQTMHPEWLEARLLAKRMHPLQNPGRQLHLFLFRGSRFPVSFGIGGAALADPVWVRRRLRLGFYCTRQAWPGASAPPGRGFWDGLGLPEIRDTQHRAHPPAILHRTPLASPSQQITVSKTVDLKRQFRVGFFLRGQRPKWRTASHRVANRPFRT